MKRYIFIVTIILACLVIINSCDDNSQKAPQNPTSQNDPNPAMNNPDSTAWQLFIQVNRPAVRNKPNGKTYWESWALASDIYHDPNKIPEWDSLTNSKRTFKNFEVLPLQQLERISNVQKVNQKALREFQPEFIPTELLQDSTTDETRVNRTVFDFIVNNDLYYVEGQERFVAQNKKIDLPIQAREVKAQWRKIKESDKNIYHWDTLRNKKGELEYWGLVSMHIISKDLPQWTWATFEHKNNYKLPDVNKDAITKSRDNYGINSNGNISTALEGDFKRYNMPDKWKNYILRGTQTNFVDLQGNPTHLSNTNIEYGFIKSSSCISCHARATVGRQISQDDFVNSVNKLFEDTKPQYITDSITQKKIREFNAQEYAAAKKIFFARQVKTFANRLPIFKTNNGDTTISDNGVPNPLLFLDKSGNIERIQTDFMWSFFRAKRRIPYKTP